MVKTLYMDRIGFAALTPLLAPSPAPLSPVGMAADASPPPPIPQIIWRRSQKFFSTSFFLDHILLNVASVEQCAHSFSAIGLVLGQPSARCWRRSLFCAGCKSEQVSPRNGRSGLQWWCGCENRHLGKWRQRWAPRAI